MAKKIEPVKFHFPMMSFTVAQFEGMLFEQTGVRLVVRMSPDTKLVIRSKERGQWNDVFERFINQRQVSWLRHAVCKLLDGCHFDMTWNGAVSPKLARRVTFISPKGVVANGNTLVRNIRHIAE